MKRWIVQFLISRAGGILTPLIAAGVAWAVTQLALWDADLATTVDQAAITAFLWGCLLSLVNGWSNKVQTAQVRKIQAVVNEEQDGWFGPRTYTEVRRAIPAK
jgi:hypothetical protein